MMIQSLTIKVSKTCILIVRTQIIWNL